jgi:hypothetical protein
VSSSLEAHADSPITTVNKNKFLNKTNDIVVRHSDRCGKHFVFLALGYILTALATISIVLQITLKASLLQFMRAVSLAQDTATANEE